ncbi:unnamed protein product, partial [Ascophyllum nodosum]
ISITFDIDGSNSGGLFVTRALRPAGGEPFFHHPHGKLKLEGPEARRVPSANAMELATGRGAVSSKDPSSVRNGGGNDGSESGRSGSGRVRESDYSYRSSVADDGRRDRHY